MLLLSSRLVSPGCGYLGDEKRSRVFFFLPSLLFINAEEILPPPTTGAGGLLIILYAVKIFDVPQLLMSGYEKCLAQFKPLAKKKLTTVIKSLNSCLRFTERREINFPPTSFSI